MSYKTGNRDQITFLPDSIDQYVLEDDPVRAYDAFVDCINLEEIGIRLNHNTVGNSAYDPVAMLKVLVYSYSYGWRSSRKIERALHHNMSFIWLAGGLKPDHKTISEFRKANLKALKKVLVQCARLCLKLKMIEGNTLFTDGSKFRANAGNRETRSLEKWKRYEKHVEARIEELLKDAETKDNTESESLISINKELKSKKKLKTKISSILKGFKEEQRVNGTDPACRIMKGRQGSHASFNVQSTTDDAHGLIVSLEGTQSSNDLNELTSQVKNAEATLEKPCKTICADAGYSSIEDLVNLVEEDKIVVVPTSRQAAKKENENVFSKEHFIYNPKSNIYICPQGKELYMSTVKEGAKKIDYRMRDANDCLTCKYFNQCTKSKQGRTIRRSVHEEIKEKIARIYNSEEGQAVYEKRKMRAELQFGHLKRNLGVGAFLLRGIDGINAELGILGTCFNIARMITISGGVCQLMSILDNVK